ncbi:MAG TPA: response regulator [Clostridiaceae bacterium]|nr:response regulator [Clostridiaceae bacterium]
MKIVIVEDEIRIREGIAKLIKKINNRYEVVGEAENGIEGLAIIKKKKPDLVITDIKMSDMDGIEMISQLKQEGISVNVIILSAYSEFAYAQQAIKLGVNEYLLKPISVGELMQSLKNIENRIEWNRTNHPEMLHSLENIFNSIILSDIKPNEELAQYLKSTHDVDIDGNIIAVIAYLGDKYTQYKDRVAKNIHAILKEKKDLRYCLLELPQNSELLIIIYKFSELKITERWFNINVLPQIRHSLQCEICFGWISFCGLFKLKDSLNLLREYMDWNIVLGNDIMISYPKITDIQFVPLSYPINIENQVRTALCERDIQRLEKEINLFIGYFQKGQLFSPKEIKESFVRFCWMIINIAKEIDYLHNEYLEQQEFLRKIVSSRTYRELEQSLRLLLDLIIKKSSIDNAASLVVQRAKSMIHEFYNQGITLNEIASKLNITPEYLGMLFNKEMGVSFSTYIKEYRINKAKEILIGKDVKLYEVAEKVGYNDPKYFCKVFKEVTNQTPSEYRKMHK